MSNGTGATVKVYEVLADGEGAGPAEDGTYVNRFKRARDAAVFAETATCHGQPAQVSARDADRKLIRRWEREGKIQ